MDDWKVGDKFFVKDAMIDFLGYDFDTSFEYTVDKVQYDGGCLPPTNKPHSDYVWSYLTPSGEKKGGLCYVSKSNMERPSKLHEVLK